MHVRVSACLVLIFISSHRTCQKLTALCAGVSHRGTFSFGSGADPVAAALEGSSHSQAALEPQMETPRRRRLPQTYLHDISEEDHVPAVRTRDFKSNMEILSMSRSAG